jgi:hypothetical protein
MEIAGWILWFVVLFFSIAGVFFLIKGLKAGLMGQTIASIICQLILVVWSAAAPGFNKLHLIWLFPLTYALSLPGSFLMIWGKWAMLVGIITIYVIVLGFVTP